MFVFRLWRAPSEEPHLVGPARLIGALPTPQRRTVVGAAARVRGGGDLPVRRAVRRIARAPRRAGRHQHVPPRAMGRAVGVGGPRAGRGRVVRVATQHERGTRHAAVVEGEPVDAARRFAPDRLRDLRRTPHRVAARFAATRGAVPHCGAVGVRDRGAGQPPHERARGVAALRAVHLPVRTRCGTAGGPAAARTPRGGDAVPGPGGGDHGAPACVPEAVGA